MSWAVVLRMLFDAPYASQWTGHRAQIPTVLRGVTARCCRHILVDARCGSGHQRGPMPGRFRA